MADYNHIVGSEDNRARCARWVFTLNNFIDDELEAIRALGDNPQVEYLCFGKEHLDEGTPHLQGTIVFVARQRFQQAKRILGERCHLEKMRGTPQQAADYCKKDGDFEEFGDVPGNPGQRNDLLALHETLKNGKRLRDVSDEHFASFIRYHRGILLWKSLHVTPRNWETLVIVYWGSTGTGKTRNVWENSTDLYSHPGGRWFDGYEGHLQVLFDEFTKDYFSIEYLLKLTDRYPMSVPVKGGFVNWAPREIYITSNIPPENWYFDSYSSHIDALKRRISHVVHFQ